MHTERYAKWLPLQVKKSETDRDHRTRTRHSGNGRSFYYLNLTVIPRVLSNVQILHGCEINVLNGGKLSLEQKYIDFLDYAIVGIHKECYTDEGKEKNTDNLIACMKNEKVHFVSHPDDDHTPLDYERLVSAAKQYRVALEVNNSSLVKKTAV